MQKQMNTASRLLARNEITPAAHSAMVSVIQAKVSKADGIVVGNDANRPLEQWFQLPVLTDRRTYKLAVVLSRIMHYSSGIDVQQKQSARTRYLMARPMPGEITEDDIETAVG
jgi:hypothetical protein